MGVCSGREDVFQIYFLHFNKHHPCLPLEVLHQLSSLGKIMCSRMCACVCRHAARVPRMWCDCLLLRKTEIKKKKKKSQTHVRLHSDPIVKSSLKMRWNCCVAAHRWCLPCWHRGLITQCVRCVLGPRLQNSSSKIKGRTKQHSRPQPALGLWS